MASRPVDWSRVKDIFAHARALPPNARVQYLTDVCDGDEWLRQDVGSLLASDERAKGFLDALPRPLTSEMMQPLEGRCIGAYEIGSRIGAGGRLTDFAGEETDVAISPDGKFPTFLSDRDGRFDAWIGRIATGEFMNVTNGRFQMMNNPNARMVGFSGDGAG